MELSNAVIDGAIRLSFSADNTIEEAELFAQALLQAKTEIMGTARR
jgi:cysteine sulfinate desulfinase/cysteine desulfurase-like protein